MSESNPSKISSRMGRLNPFKSKSRREEDDEDKEEVIDENTLAGGGHSALATDIAQQNLRVSDALKSFLSHEGVLSEDDTDGLNALLGKPIVSPPAHLIDRSHPLPEYFISSSHNTYLLAHQLYGKSSAGAYETTLRAGARCIEIDAWDHPDNPEEPKVTHGYTLTSNIPFRTVCESIRDAVDREAAEPAVQGFAPAPILVSLENHCDSSGQLRLVQIMKEVWGDRLLSAPVRQKGHEEQEGGHPVRLDELGSKIAVIVEYHLPDEVDDSSSSSSSSSSSDSEEEKQAREEYKAKKKAAPPAIIIPELAEFGVYAQSVKPRDNSWYIDGKIKDGPPEHHLINISESGLASHTADHAADVARHNGRHLMRVFPKGTRISSRNLSPIPFWAVGAQICALNWQTFSASMQLNHALFAGTAGYVLKPAALRFGALSQPPRKTLRLRVAGATDIALPNGRDVEGLKPYLTCTLLRPGSGTELVKVKRKTAVYQSRKTLTLPFLGAVGGKGENPPQTDPVWDETLEWEFENNELVFLRMLLKSDDSFSSNVILAVTAVRLLYVESGWRFVRMLDLRGHETACSLLVKFDIQDA
ncbi:PLC-like phosphodiesterase [Chaetomidium leptoderma]|uniref:Phosphoinositide phospholipase C n=1 Tax=Chaetomidium leptoderma TaxID=669021 RepID=A0AAN6VEH4_9PEZI|nr:PLC-like phosphodiesterase [Chaetomidium leptoderma]